MKLYLKMNCPVTGRRAFDTTMGVAIEFDGDWVFVTDRGATVSYPLPAIHALELGDGEIGPRKKSPAKR